MGRGRPSKYRKDYHPYLARLLARDGKTDEQIAQWLEVGAATHQRWKRDHPEYRAALNESKAVVDLQVQNLLLQRALGYTTERVEEIVNQQGEVVRRKVVRQTVPPSVTAQKFWLKNRQREKWSEQPEEEGDGPGGFLKFLDLSREANGMEPDPDAETQRIIREWEDKQREKV